MMEWWAQILLVYLIVKRGAQAYLWESDKHSFAVNIGCAIMWWASLPILFYLGGAFS